MNLRQLDLNLLVALDALLKARHVTRAGRMLGIGQPAMSAALQRLRAVFDDDLLVKQGREMVPTARALELEPELRRVLREVERLVGEREAFDPGRSARSFVVRLSDLLSFLLLPHAVATISREAPGIALEALHLSPEATVDALESGRVDLAVSTGLSVPASICASAVCRDEVVAVSRRGHPAVDRLCDVDVFLAQRHIKVAQSPIDDRFADRQLAKQGRTRSAALTVPHWLAVPPIVATSDMIATMPASLARRYAADGHIVLHRPPFPETRFDWSLYWHRRHTGDQGHMWLRGVLTTAAADAFRLGAETGDETGTVQRLNPAVGGTMP
ncbi:MAG: LysR family transcriptional regulator [Thalassobaculaceae bacterium]|nr:LysR family transcriptional regulator [Thalassobaculaceae bacterium]